MYRFYIIATSEFNYIKTEAALFIYGLTIYSFSTGVASPVF